MRRRALVALTAAGLLASACGQRVPAEPVAEARPDPASEAPGTGTAEAPAAAPEPTPPPEAPDPVERAAPYEGLGAWIDVFDRPLWRDPEGVVADLDRRGVRTLFLQTNTYRFPGPFRFREATGRFLDAAHGRGMAVVGWYVPDFKRPRRDLAMLLAAVDFRSPRGGSFDSVAVDIEATEVTDPAVRAQRAVKLSWDLREAVGPAYPLGGIIPSPIRGPHFWPILPTAELARAYDVLLPMAYWSHSESGEAAARSYIARSLEILRGEVGPDPEIHVIGGVADGTTPAEIRGFVRAARGPGIVGASIYDVATMSDAEWAALAPLA